MIGAIIGDIVGSRFEFNNAKTTDFKLFTSECSFTDDTICTVAIADAILTGKSYRVYMIGAGNIRSLWVVMAAHSLVGWLPTIHNRTIALGMALPCV